MPRTLNERLTPSMRPHRLTQLSLLLCALMLLAACGAVPTEPQFINVKPKLDPLPAQVSQAIQPNSTDLLKRADLWLENSGQLLNCVTDSSCKSVSN